MMGLGPHTRNTRVKFLCSYGGKILPRYPDGKLRYHGGHTRVVGVPRSILFSELLLKMGEVCGSAVSLRCQLPNEDLDALVSITSDEDLANLIEEYDRLQSSTCSLKIRAFLSPPKSFNNISSSSSSSSTSPSSSFSKSSSSSSSSSRSPTPTPACACACACSGYPVQRVHPTPFRFGFDKSGGRNIPLPHYAYHAQTNPAHFFLIHNANHWQ